MYIKKEIDIMKSFNYVITDSLGIHARPAGILVKAASAYSSKITISKNGKEADLKRILGVMGLGVKKDDEIVIKINGEDEEKAAEELKKIFVENL